MTVEICRTQNILGSEVWPSKYTYSFTIITAIYHSCGSFKGTSYPLSGLLNLYNLHQFFAEHPCETHHGSDRWQLTMDYSPGVHDLLQPLVFLRSMAAPHPSIQFHSPFNNVFFLECKGIRMSCDYLHWVQGSRKGDARNCCFRCFTSGSHVSLVRVS